MSRIIRNTLLSSCIVLAVSIAGAGLGLSQKHQSPGQLAGYLPLPQTVFADDCVPSGIPTSWYGETIYGCDPPTTYFHCRFDSWSSASSAASCANASTPIYVVAVLTTCNPEGGVWYLEGKRGGSRVFYQQQTSGTPIVTRCFTESTWPDQWCVGFLSTGTLQYIASEEWWIGCCSCS